MGMTATALAPSPAAESQVVLIESPCSEPVLSLLGYSRWRVEPVPSIGTVLIQIERGSVPVVICGACDWRDVVAAARRSLRPPAVIVLTAMPEDREWAEVLKADAHYIDVRHLDAPHLFSLLNLLWRAWHKD
jgi:hypothetical protein